MQADLRPAALWTFAKSTASKFLDDNCLTRGAAISFYTVTSLIPILLVVIAIAGLVIGHDAAAQAVTAQVTSLMGQQTADLLASAIAKAAEPSSGILAGVIGTATLIATISGTFGELQSALNAIWKAKPKDAALSRLVRARAASIGLVVTLGFLLTVSLAVSAALTVLSDRINAVLPFGNVLLTLLNGFISLILISALFAAVFKVLPDVSIRWRDVVFGALVTGILFTAGKALIGWYIGSSDVASAYGAAGGLIVLLLWVYYSAQIFLLGAELTYLSTSRRQGRHLSRGRN